MHLLPRLKERMNQQQLLKECRQGKATAQRILFDQYAAQMTMVCCRYIKSERDAEEIMLDGFYKFFNSIGKFEYKGDAALYTWLRQIMINECLMFLRRRNAFIMMADSDHEPADWDESALDKISADEIFNMIVALPIGYRTVFNLFAIEGMSHKEIARLLDITEGTSKSQLAKARQLLQKMLIKKDEEYAARKIK